MTKRPGLRAAIIAAVAAASLGGPTAVAEEQAPSPNDETSGKLLLMLDASGSMAGADPSGLTKIEAAKKALTDVVGTLPERSQVGLRVYGSAGDQATDACRDSQLVAPIAPLDKSALNSAIAAFAAKGETPIAYSLEQALGDLGTEGKRNIVLVSDGEETCVPDPCPVVEKLIGSGIDLQIDTVGFGVGPVARAQLTCLAAAGNGSYYEAKDAEELATSLAKLATRAIRPFAVGGSRIEGRPELAGAPAISAGQYVDTLTTGAGERHYSVRRTIPGSTLRIAATMRPSYVADGDNHEVVDMEVRADSSGCERRPAQRVGTSNFEHPVSETLRVPGRPEGSTATSNACQTATELDFTLDRTTGASTPSDVEILVVEEPPAVAVKGLPDPDGKPEQSAPAPSAPQPIVGGTSFSSAPRIAPGSWQETFVSGETIFYRVPVSWGQRLRLAVVPAEGAVTDDVRRLTHFNPVLYAPDRRVLGEISLNSGTFTIGAGKPTEQTSRAVRYRNREIPGGGDSDLAGDHFISIAVPHNRQGREIEVPMTFRVEVEGDESGAPTYESVDGKDVAPTPETQVPDGVAAPEAQDESAIGVWLGVGAVGVLLVAGTAWFALRRRQ